MIVWTDEPDMFGPPKPPACVAGPESHAWQFSLEEGQVTLTSGCNLCDDGLSDYIEPEDWEMEPIPVRLECHVEGPDYHGDTTVWWEIKP